MKLQTDKAFNVISRLGCYFVSLGKKAEIITGKVITVEQVMKVYAEAVCSGLMDWNCYVMKPGKLCSLFIYEMNHNTSVHVKYIGWWNVDTGLDMWEDVKASFDIVRYRTKYGHHFGLEDWNPDPSLHILSVTGKRFFKVVGGND